MGFYGVCGIFLIGCPRPLPLELSHFICVADSCEVYREHSFSVVAYRYHNLGILKAQREVWASCRGNIAVDDEMGLVDGL